MSDTDLISVSQPLTKGTCLACSAQDVPIEFRPGQDPVVGPHATKIWPFWPNSCNGVGQPPLEALY